MTRDPALMGFIDRLYGETAIRQPRFVPRAVYPHPDNPWSEMAAHQDMPYVQGSLDALTAWMPMGHCLNSGGALEVLRGSHLSGLRGCVGSGKYRCAATEVDVNDPEWRCADFEPGDVLIFTCLTVHRARRNMSEVVRLTMDARYQPADSAMCEKLLQTPFYPKVADWSELLDAEELERVRNTRPTRLIPFDEPAHFVAPDRGRVFDWMRG
jgi:ectoine hydroxylase-related dioxygenase (phytanoyl-CoA dioxygenase family)